MTRLPERLVLTALRLAPDPYGEYDDRGVERQLVCTLQAHPHGDHHAVVRELDGPGGGAVWAQWVDGARPQAVGVRADCPAVVTDGARSEACAEFLGHAGAHTWECAQPS
ncbi:hypothetical protein [Streptomyces montanisoli]|uniref:Uncharacterized protein n=1 Tax=Streptomyces montanisoli TaxID=2798581 RepID=A0A940MJ12_9ACTN|nr:hypothetical protein [Streptomyces montanisoli]MBP0460602.1 hypothetical protein [Streptomyces montanisoli]